MIATTISDIQPKRKMVLFPTDTGNIALWLDLIVSIEDTSNGKAHIRYQAGPDIFSFRVAISAEETHALVVEALE